MKFEYDYSSLFSPDKLKIDYIPSADGEYIRDTILGDVAKASRMDLVSEAAKYRITGDANDNKAMITEANTPQQIMPQRKGESLADGLRIQCSANGRDYIYIPRQKLSVNRMGLRKLNVKLRGRRIKRLQCWMRR